ncbi:MAG: pstA [Rickettsiaceae bacterium]|jgi:phosphate transport system permease protein|nr:pstA [Rickettsiaceae bacterium]
MIDILERFKRRRKALKKLTKRKRIYRRIELSLAKRRAADKRFRMYGAGAVAISFIFLIILLYNIIGNGYTAFIHTQINLPITFTEEAIGEDDYRRLVKNSLQGIFPDVTERVEKRMLDGLISSVAEHELKSILEKNPDYKGQTKDIWLLASTSVDMFAKGKISPDTPENTRKISDKQIGWITALQGSNSVRKVFNSEFFTSGDSREPEQAGILGGLVGSILVIISCMLLAFPLGVMTAIYLEEFAPKNRFTEFIEVNISNLAAVPSIVFGLLGITIYFQFFGIPRSASLAGGFTLALLALPVMVIATRTSIKAVPQSIRDGAMALGASKLQTTLHHVLPLAMPGIMTGTILSISRVLGETAPLLMIGMVAFIVDIPKGFLDAATVMPVQVYLWADNPELGFIEKTSAAIIVLLLFLILANAAAVYLRKKFEIRW